MTQSVKYSRSESYRTLPMWDSTLRPYIPVSLQYGGKHFDTTGLIDSGADGAMFNQQIAEYLGIDLNKCPVLRMTGIGGTIEVRLVDMFIKALGKRFPAKVAFDPHFSAQFGLLGRNDFFVNFRVGFDQPANKVLLHPLSP